MSRCSTYLRQNILGLVAIFIALTMGTAYATHPGGQNTISSDDLQNQAVTTPKIADEAVTNQKIAPLTIRENSIRGSAVTNDKIAAATIRTGKLSDAVITTPKLADNSVNSAKVVDNSLTSADIDESTLAQRIRWRGAWVDTTTCGPPFPCALPEPYAKNDAVEYNGSSYIAKVNIQCSAICAADVPPDSSSDWDLLARKGEDGAPSPALWAVVASGAFTAGDATLVRGSGAVSVAQPAGDFGNYFVTFDRDVNNCAYIATIGSPNGVYTGSLGEIQATRSISNNRQVRVLTYPSDGGTTRINRGFNLAVYC